MKKDKMKIRTGSGLKQYTYLGCPLTNNRSPWCFRLCEPDAKGLGRCGRVAPHGIKSRIQLGIDDYKKSNLKSHLRKLERMYLSAACNDYYKPGISISEGMAEVVIPVKKKFLHAAGSVHGSVYFKAMDDAAFFAVNSLVQDVGMLTVNFNVFFTRAVSGGTLIARGRFMGVSGHHYMAEAVLADEKGKEIGRGQGAFVRSKIPLTSETGYT